MPHICLVFVLLCKFSESLPFTFLSLRHGLLVPPATFLSLPSPELWHGVSYAPKAEHAACAAFRFEVPPPILYNSLPLQQFPCCLSPQFTTKSHASESRFQLGPRLSTVRELGWTLPRPPSFPLASSQCDLLEKKAQAEVTIPQAPLMERML